MANNTEEIKGDLAIVLSHMEHENFLDEDRARRLKDFLFMAEGKLLLSEERDRMVNARIKAIAASTATSTTLNTLTTSWTWTQDERERAHKVELFLTSVGIALMLAGVVLVFNLGWLGIIAGAIAGFGGACIVSYYGMVK